MSWLDRIFSPRKTANRAAEKPRAESGRLGVSQLEADFQMAAVTRQFARGLTPQRIAAVFDSATRTLCDQVVLADEIEEADDHLRGTLALRRAAVQRLDKTIVSGDDKDPQANRAAELAREMIDQPWFHKASSSLLRATFLQYAATEILYTAKDIDGRRMFMPTSQRPVESGRWYVSPQGELGLYRRLGQKTATDIVPLLPGRFAWMEWDTTAVPGQMAIVRCIALLHMLARLDIKQWGTMIDQWGIPLIAITYRADKSRAEVQAIIDELLTLAGRRIVATPEGTSVETTEVPEQTPHADFQDWARRAMSRLLIGQDSSQMAIEGQKTGATLQGNVRDDIRDEDALQLDAAQNETLLAPWCLWNFGPDVKPPRIKRSVRETKDPVQRGNIFKIARELGLALISEQVYSDLGIEMPDGTPELIAGGSLGQVDSTLASSPSDGGGKVGTGEGGNGTAPLADGVAAVADTGLNGAQIDALQTILQAVTNGEQSPDVAREMIAVAFPAITADRIDRMVDAAVGFTPRQDAVNSGLETRSTNDGLQTRPTNSKPPATLSRGNGLEAHTTEPVKQSIVDGAAQVWAGIFKGHSAAIRTLAEEVAKGEGSDADKAAEFKRRLPELLSGFDPKQRAALLAKAQLAALGKGVLAMDAEVKAKVKGEK